MSLPSILPGSPMSGSPSPDSPDVEPGQAPHLPDRVATQILPGRVTLQPGEDGSQRPKRGGGVVVRGLELQHDLGAGLADLLEISPKTVDTYRSRLMEKLDIHDVAGLVKFSIVHGLTTLE